MLSKELENTLNETFRTAREPGAMNSSRSSICCSRYSTIPLRSQCSKLAKSIWTTCAEN